MSSNDVEPTLDRPAGSTPPTAPLVAGPQPGRRVAALAGAVATGSALGVGELASGLFSGVPSMTVSVGQLFIPFTPEGLKDVAIALFDTADKPVFVGGVVVVSLLIGAWAGMRARTDRMPALLLFLGFGLFGLFASSSVAGASVGLVTLTALAAVGTGLWVLARLLALASAWAAVDELADEPIAGEQAAPTVADPSALGRRPFLLGTAAAAVTAVASSVFGAVMRGARAESLVSSSDVALPPTTGSTAPPTAVTSASFTAAQDLPVPGLTPIVVPNPEFYRIDTALGTPLVDAGTWELRVRGMVDREVTLSYDDLRSREIVERYVTIACVSNEVGDKLVGNALWTGVLLGPLLDELGVQPGAGQVVGRSVDGWDAGFPIEAAFDRDAMIAFGMNGVPLPAEHGFPARLIVPGLYGYVSATKWLQEIEITTWEGFDGFWIPRGWAKEGPIKTQSRIDVPRDGARLEAAGETVVAGVAWAPGRGIARVEVRADEGPWVEAELSEPLSGEAWVQWRAVLDLPEGPSNLQVRATDGEGETQTADRVPPRPDGATGHHTIRVFT